MSETIITTLITAVSTLLVTFVTCYFTIKKDREKQVEEIKGVLNQHREEYLSGIRDVQDEVLKVNSTVQQQIAIIELKIDTLSERVDKHNSVIERTFKLEQASAVHEEKIKVANNRIADLEHRADENK